MSGYGRRWPQNSVTPPVDPPKPVEYENQWVLEVLQTDWRVETVGGLDDVMSDLYYYRDMVSRVQAVRLTYRKANG